MTVADSESPGDQRPVEEPPAPTSIAAPFNSKRFGRINPALRQWLRDRGAWTR
jgi:hypothetical protein